MPDACTIMAPRQVASIQLLAWEEGMVWGELLETEMRECPQWSLGVQKSSNLLYTGRPGQTRGGPGACLHDSGETRLYPSTNAQCRLE